MDILEIMQEILDISDIPTDKALVEVRVVDKQLDVVIQENIHTKRLDLKGTLEEYLTTLEETNKPHLKYTYDVFNKKHMISIITYA